MIQCWNTRNTTRCGPSQELVAVERRRDCVVGRELNKTKKVAPAISDSLFSGDSNPSPFLSWIRFQLVKTQDMLSFLSRFQFPVSVSTKHFPLLAFIFPWFSPRTEQHSLIETGTEDKLNWVPPLSIWTMDFYILDIKLANSDKTI